MRPTLPLSAYTEQQKKHNCFLSRFQIKDINMNTNVYEIFSVCISVAVQYILKIKVLCTYPTKFSKSYVAHLDFGVNINVNI